MKHLSLGNVEENISASFPLLTHRHLARPDDLRVVVAQPGCLLAVIDVADVMTHGGGATDMTDHADQLIGVRQVTALSA